MDYKEHSLLFTTEEEVVKIMHYMRELLDRYGCITVADLYDLIGMECYYTDNLYGWTKLNIFAIVDMKDNSGRFELKLPKPLPIENEVQEII